MAIARYLTGTALLLMLTAPAAAQWSAFGSFEPNTGYDEGWVWPDAPEAGESKIYFNAISGSHYPPASALGKPWLNPNVGLLRTQIEPLGLEYHNAILGVWIDCNGDDYIGLAESAMREYPASALGDSTICPPATGPIDTWTAGAHNYNGWVSEFIPVIRGVNQSLDARTYVDNDTRVWGDFDRPDEHPTYRTCPLFPWPRGTYESTGGVLNYLDCRAALLEAWNNAMTAVGDPAGLSFANANDARTGTLGQVWLGGPEDDSHSPATVWDCEADDPLFHSGDATNESGATLPAQAQNLVVYNVDPQPGNLDDPSATGLANHTFEGLQPLQSVAGPDESWDCDTSNDFGHDVYTVLGTGAPETDFNGVDPNNKIQANWNFGTSTTTRGGTVVSATAAGTTVNERVNFPLFGGAAGMPQDGGVGTGGTRWVSDSTWGTKPGPRSVKADLETGSVGIASAYWLTFYARLGETTLEAGHDVPSDEPGTYGSWACGQRTSGIHSGWNCDASVWYRNADGSFPNDPDQIRAKPGFRYHLRDVDCYDGRIGDSGASVGLSYYGPDPCP